MSKSDKRQRQRENRAERRAREEREARRRRTVRFATRAGIVLAVIIGAGVVLSFLGGDDEPAATTLAATTTTVAATTTQPAPTTTTQPAPTTTLDPEALSAEYLAYRELPVACGAEAPPEVQPMQFDAPEDLALPPDEPVTATLSTSCGDIVMELDPGQAPETVNSFVFLAQQGYFEGVVSHRLLPGFVVQFGDQTARGDGGPGYNVPDEFPEGEFTYDRGVVAMANVSSVPNSTGSQFFLPLGPTTLEPAFNPVGRVVEGLEVLDLIAQIPVAGQRPLEALYIEDITVDVP